LNSSHTEYTPSTLVIVISCFATPNINTHCESGSASSGSGDRRSIISISLQPSAMASLNCPTASAFSSLSSELASIPNSERPWADSSAQYHHQHPTPQYLASIIRSTCLIEIASLLLSVLTKGYFIHCTGFGHWRGVVTRFGDRRAALYQRSLWVGVMGLMQSRDERNVRVHMLQGIK